MTERHLTLTILIAVTAVFISVANRVGIALGFGTAFFMLFAGLMISVLFQRYRYSGLSRIIAFLVVCLLAYELSSFDGLGSLMAVG